MIQKDGGQTICSRCSPSRSWTKGLGGSQSWSQWPYHVPREASIELERVVLSHWGRPRQNILPRDNKRCGTIENVTYWKLEEVLPLRPLLGSSQGRLPPEHQALGSLTQRLQKDQHNETRQLWCQDEATSQDNRQKNVDGWRTQKVLDEGLKKHRMKDSKSTKVKHDGGIRPNVLEAHGSGKLDQCEEKSITTKAQGQICPRCMSWEKSTCARENLPWRRYKIKCTRDAWVRKTWPAWREICHNRGTGQIVLEARVDKTWSVRKEIYHSGGIGQNMPKAHELGKHAPREEKSTITEVQGKMCPRCIS